MLFDGAMKLFHASRLLIVGWLMLSMTAIAADKRNQPAAEAGAVQRPLLVYVGTYTGARSKGIYVYRMDLTSGALSPSRLAAEIVNPTFLAIHPNQRFLYAANEIGDFGGKKSGAVSAFAIDPETGKLALLNQISSRGGGPCHLVVDAAGKNVLVANYGGGSVAVLPLEADGKLREASAFIQHEGSSVNRQRQEAPHAHGVALDVANRFAFVTDLGLDKIMTYKFDAATGALAAHDVPWTATKPGAGPRHFVFDPRGRFAYVINELDSTITGFAYDATRGLLKEIQSVPTLPAGFKGENSTAEVEVHPSGRFLYGSNRGDDSIVVYTIDPASGKLAWVERQSTRGKMPRNFGIDPTGAFLLAANQGSDTVVLFRINRETGRLAPTGGMIEVGAPVCVKFVEGK